MSFKNLFPVIAAFFTSKSAEGLNEIKAEDGFTKIELSAEQFTALETQMKTLADKAAKGETAETALITAQKDLADAKVTIDTLTKEKADAEAKVVALNKDIEAKEAKIKELGELAAGDITTINKKGQEAQLEVEAGKEKFTAEWAEKNGLIF